MPTYNDTLPIEMAVVRSCGGKYRAATFVIEFSTSGWPSATTNCPARAQPYDAGPSSRSSPPPAVRIAPTESACSNRASSHRPQGSARTTYMSGKIPARSPTAPAETPITRWACVVIGAYVSHRSWVHAASRPYPPRIAHRLDPHRRDGSRGHSRLRSRYPARGHLQPSSSSRPRRAMGAEFRSGWSRRPARCARVAQATGKFRSARCVINAAGSSCQHHLCAELKGLMRKVPPAVT